MNFRLPPAELPRFISPAVVCVAVVALSCGDFFPAGQSGDLSRLIVGGTTDYGHPEVGALTGDHLCTGTLISKKLVLTAAHCFKNGYVYDEFRLGVDALAPDKSYGVGECFQHPDFAYLDIGGVNTPIHDIAICVLSSNVPGVAPMPFRTSLFDGQEGASVTFVGYGMDSGQGTGLGTKRVVTVEVDSINEYGFYNVVSGSTVKNTCTGDSGAPGLVEEGGVDRIAGVVSAGDKNCTKNGWNTRVDLHVDWIMEIVETHDPGSVDAGMPQDAAVADTSHPSDGSNPSDGPGAIADAAPADAGQSDAGVADQGGPGPDAGASGDGSGQAQPADAAGEAKDDQPSNGAGAGGCSCSNLGP